MSGTNYRDWQRNLEKNIELYREGDSIMTQYGSWNGDKCLYVGAGLTATRQIEGIRNAKSKGWRIVCADRIHSMLRSRGVKPDLVVSADKQDCVINFFGCVGKDDTVALCLTQSPRMIRRVMRKAGRVYFFILANPLSAFSVEAYAKYPKELFAVKSHQTVGFMAVDIAVNMGCTTIATIGNECGWFCEDDIEQSYKRDMPVRIVRNVKTGQFMYTIDPFLQTAHGYRTFPRMYPDINFYECSNGTVEAFEQIDLDELLEA